MSDDHFIGGRWGFVRGGITVFSYFDYEGTHGIVRLSIYYIFSNLITAFSM